MITDTGLVVPDASPLHELSAHGEAGIAVTVTSVPES
jgi:hypothetical protein